MRLMGLCRGREQASFKKGDAFSLLPWESGISPLTKPNPINRSAAKDLKNLS
jgi:hypothetical protein